VLDPVEFGRRTLAGLLLLNVRRTAVVIAAGGEEHGNDNERETEEIGHLLPGFGFLASWMPGVGDLN